MRILSVVTLAGLVVAPTFAATPSEDVRKVGDLGKVGTVEFPTSCDPALQDEFERGMALLHSFFYSEARRVFEGVADKDPECAMAHWGVAMTYYHPLWAPPDSSELLAGTAAIERAAKAKKQAERERAYIVAMRAYYEGLDVPDLGAAAVAPSCHGDPGVDYMGRAACFRREMEKVATAYPDDVDGAAFFALALLGTAPAGDPKLKNQQQAAEMLEKWYTRLPDHPGLAHYLIHSYDYPATAAKGLPAAEAYADIAPWVPHSLHMPSHIFTRLGMWDETIRSNLASAEAGRKLAQEADVAYFEEMHALDYLAYGYLQTAQDQKVKALVDYVNGLKGIQPAADPAGGYAYGAIPARYALERRLWKEAASLEVPPMTLWGKLPHAEGHRWYARAIGAAKIGELPGARAAAERLEALSKASTDLRFGYFAEKLAIQRRAALALIAFAEGERTEAIEMLRVEAAAEDSLGKSPVSPGALFPVRELYAEALLDAGKPAEALVQFEASLKIYPRRFNGLYGAARAAEKAGKKPEARRYYEQLLELAKPGDSARPELAEARDHLAKL